MLARQPTERRFVREIAGYDDARLCFAKEGDIEAGRFQRCTFEAAPAKAALGEGDSEAARRHVMRGLKESSVSAAIRNR